MSNYTISPGMAGGYGPGLPAYDDNSSSSSSDGSASAFEPEEAALEAAKEEEEAGAQMPLPPMTLLHSNPEQFVMEFMFLPRPVRMREADLEFYALSWEPITKRQLMRCCEYLSRRLSELMNENVELERRVKNLGPRKTTVLTEDPYEVVTVEIMRNEGWNRDDVVWCICEGMKKYPKELTRNQRFKTRLGLPVPGEDYEIVGGKVTTHAIPQPAEDNEDDPVEANTPKAPTKPSRPAPATKVGGVRRKTNKKRNTASSSTAPKKASAAAPKRTAKRAPNEDGDESEFNVADASPSKKRRSPMNRKPAGAAPIPSKPLPVTPPSKTSSARKNAAAGSSKQGAKPKKAKSGGSSKKSRVKKEGNDDVFVDGSDDTGALLANARGSYGTFGSPDDADTSDNSGGSDDPADSDDSDKTITQDTYSDGLSEVSMGRA
ncbi:hypothetical protein GTA08_BOTSDO00948 [Neofusicoccum parvum]|uniref:Uncharacterized protein n=1 Tax=Neofusicoccum parvum TaxID=310453 RepID=A0ACB5SMS3_9PEZI|nr:hypothetical protein GTA08_BOTSDO00948 [Neofusicoccum parvum]